jgi:hypothetical protein
VLPTEDVPRTLDVPVVSADVPAAPMLPTPLVPGSLAMMRGVPVLPTVGPLLTAPLQPGRLVEFCEIDEPLACPAVELGATPEGVGLLATPGTALGATPDGVGLLTMPGTDGLATAPLGCPPLLALGAPPAAEPAEPAAPPPPPAPPPPAPPPPLLDCANERVEVASKAVMMKAARVVRSNVMAVSRSNSDRETNVPAQTTVPRARVKSV